MCEIQEMLEKVLFPAAVLFAGVVIEVIGRTAALRHAQLGGSP
jgi:hypothetical protein